MNALKYEENISVGNKIEKYPSPEVSVITVCLNSSKSIEKTIRSVINQTYENLEYIVIDGGSDDGTLEILNSYDTCIDHWISEPDEGIYDAMNKGVELASGDYLIFMNSGDCFNDNYIVTRVMEECGKVDRNLDTVSLIYGNALVINEELGIGYKKKKERFNIKDFYSGQPICHQAVFFRKNLFNEVGIYNKNLKLLGDYEWFIRFFNNKKKYITRFIDIDIVRFQMDGLSIKLFDKAFIERKKIVKQYFPPFHFFIQNLSYPFIYLECIILRLIRETKFFKVLLHCIVFFRPGLPQEDFECQKESY